MILEKRYKNLNDTLAHLKMQVIDSLPYAQKVCPYFETPKELWKWIDPKYRFVDDDKNKIPGKRPRELLQTMQTLVKHGWKGDCDCIVITTLACLIVNQFPGVYIALVGRKRSNAVHIYTVVYFQGERIVLDFTNKGRYNYERPGEPPYKYIQEIPVKWENWHLQKILN